MITSEKRGSVLDEPPDAADDLGRPVGLLADLLQRGHELFVPLRRFQQAHETSAGVVVHGMQRLVQFVRQARSHFAHHAQASHVRQFRPMPLQLLIVGLLEYLLGLFQVFDVRVRANQQVT